MYEIPTTVIVNNKEFHIRNNGDYRMVLDCFAALGDSELSKQERLFASLLIFYDELEEIEDIEIFDDLEEPIRKMYEFFNCNSATDVGTHSNYKLVDWKDDAQLITSAINKVANMEIRAQPYIHWWTFMGYYTAVGECPLSTIIGIRDKIMKGKKLEKHESAFRAENPQYFIWNSKTVDAKEADELAKSLWNGGDN